MALWVWLLSPRLIFLKCFCVVVGICTWFLLIVDHLPSCVPHFAHPSTSENSVGCFHSLVIILFQWKKHLSFREVLQSCYSYILSGVRLDSGWWLLVHSLIHARSYFTAVCAWHWAKPWEPLQWARCRRPLPPWGSHTKGGSPLASKETYKGVKWWLV